MDKKFEDKTSGKILGLIIAFITCVLTFLICCMVILSTSALSNKFVTSTIQKTNYSAVLSGEINEQFVNLAKISGASEAVYSGLVTKKMVEASTIKYFKACMADNKYISNTNAFEKKLRTNLNNYIKKQDNSSITEEELAKNVNDLISVSVKTYNTNIEIKYVPLIGSYINRINSFIAYFVFGMAFLDLIFLGIMLLFFRRKNLLRFLIYSFSGTAVMLFAVPIFVNLSGVIPRIAINSESLYILATNLLNRLFNKFYLFGLITLVFVACFAILYIMRVRSASKEV